MRKPISALSLGLLFSWSLLAGGAQPVGEAAKEDMKKLEGTWKLVSMVMGGMEVPADKLATHKLVFKADKMTYFQDGKAVKTFGITLDPAKKPKAMDWINLEDKDAIKLPAIFSIDGNELKLCFPLLPKKGEKALLPITRPEDFDTTDRPAGLFVAKREKP